MSATSYEVRTRLGAVPITFNTPEGAFNWLSKQPHAATLSVWAVETIRRERQLTPATVTPLQARREREDRSTRKVG